MLNFFLSLPVRAENAGVFVSPGHGIHPDRTIASHELILVRRGCLHLQEGARTFAVGPGETLLLQPKRRHRGVQPYGPDLTFYWIHFHLRPPRGGTAFRLPQYSTPRHPDRLYEIFHRFMEAQESANFPQTEADLLLTLLLTEASRSGPPGAAPAGIAARAATFIAENFHRPLGAGMVARALQLNADYLGRIHQQAHGHTLTEAIHRRRLREARALLRESASSVKQIAAICGFADDRYFRRLFTRHQGISPRRYRQLHARTHVNTR